MNKIVTYILGIIIIFGGIYLMTTNDNYINPDIQAKKQAKSSTSSLSAIEDDFDFGTISMKKGDVFHSFEIKNDGDESILIDKVYTSCMCTTVEITDSSEIKYGKFGMPGHDYSSDTNIEIKAGESANVKVIYDPAAHGPSAVGFVQRSVYIETNSLELPKFELAIQAMVTR